MNIKYLLYLIIISITASCSGGLEPHDKDIPKSYFAGKIYYKGGIKSWPSADSVKAIRVVGFKVFPPKDVIEEVVSGNAFFNLLSLPMFVDSSSYRIEIPSPPVDLKYIAVALQFTDSLTAQKAIGVYNLDGNHDHPAELLITKGKFFDNINITVDFNDLPVTPF